MLSTNKEKLHMRTNTLSPASAGQGDFRRPLSRRAIPPQAECLPRGLALLTIYFLSLSPIQKGQLTSPIACPGWDTGSNV